MLTVRRWLSSSTTREAWIVATIGFIEALVITLAAGRVSYRYDESVTIGAFIGRGWLVPFTRQRLHNNHPAFSFLENLVWIVGGDSELVFRLLPALFLAVAVALLGGWTTQRWGVLAGTGATLVMVTHPLVIDFGRQVRGYSLALLAATGSTLLAVRLLRKLRDVWASVGYVAAVAIGLATHLYVAPIVLVHIGLVVSSRRFDARWVLRWVLGSAFGLLAYISIPPTGVRRGFQSSFPGDATWALLGETWLSLVVLGGCTALFVVFHRRLWLSIALPLLATVYVWWVAELATIHPRYFLWVVPFIAVAAAWAVSWRKWVAIPTLVAATAMAIVAWPIGDPGIRDAAVVAAAAHAHGYSVCTVGLEAMWAYSIRGSEFHGQPCDVLISVGTWRPGGYDEARAALPYHAELGDVHVASAVNIAALLEGDIDGGRVTAAAPSAEPLLLNDNGGWSWFQDERAVIDPDRCALVVSSVADSRGSGGEQRDGDIEVVAFEFTTSRLLRSALSTGSSGDNQNSAALHVRADGRYVAMYASHDADTFTRWRVSRRPGDATDWEPEQTLNNGAPTSYSNIYAVPEEGRLYAFVRSAERDPHFLVSSDDGSTWTVGGQLLASPGDPYVRYIGDGAGRIHLFATDGHPRDEYRATGVYHGVIERGRLLRSDNAVVDAHLFDEEAAQVDILTRVFAAEGVRVQVVDIELDADGNPQVVFSTRLPSLIAADNIRTYHFARFDGSTWHVHPMAKAGNALSPAQPDYTGLAALVPRQSSRVFLSTDVDPAAGVPLVSNRDRRQHFELFEGVTTDGGETWTWSPVTSNSTADNIRPIALRTDAGTSVLWLRGTYTDDRQYDLDVVGRLADGCAPSAEAP